jgi:predicted ATPase
MKCECTQVHTPRRIVLTGGPGAGKTAVLELIRQAFCEHVHVVPEAASVVYGGGFPRLADLEARRAAQRAIFHVQRELEVALGGADAAVLLCDRGTLDGQAYWPGTGSLWVAVGTTAEAELARYHAVIHLRTPSAGGGYDHRNPLRVETADEAAAIDARIAAAWATHPRRHEVAATADFLTKAARVVEILRAAMPACCREHPIAALRGRS